MTQRSRFSWICRGLAQGALALLLPGAMLALNAPPALEELSPDDRDALETIATYDEATREAVLKASLHVDVLVEAQRVQQQSSERFSDRIENLPEDLQGQVWDVVRVPDLLEELTDGGPKSEGELDALVAKHPEKLEDAIRTLSRSHYDLLADIMEIDRSAWGRFESLLSEIPEDEQQAFRDLVDRPDLLSLLAMRVRLAVYLGDSYRASPESTRRHLSELASEVARREADAEEEWRTAIAEDDGAASELEDSARLYADEYGYDYDDLTDSEVRTTVRTVVYPYPYWFGYPPHYANHYLYPYGYWYHYPAHLGFHYGHGHHRVYFGLPSPHYLYWFFGSHHDRHYGHLSHRFSRHHKHHRYARGKHHRVLGRWAKHRGHRDKYGHWRRDFNGHRNGFRRDSSDARRGGRRHFGPRRDRGLRAGFVPERGREGREARRTRRGERGPGDGVVRDRQDRRRGDSRRAENGDARPRERRGERGPGDGVVRDRQDRRRGDSRRAENGDARPRERRGEARRTARQGSRGDLRASKAESRQVRRTQKVERRAQKVQRRAQRGEQRAEKRARSANSPRARRANSQGQARRQPAARGERRMRGSGGGGKRRGGQGRRR